MRLVPRLGSAVLLQDQLFGLPKNNEAARSRTIRMPLINLLICGAACLTRNVCSQRIVACCPALQTRPLLPVCQEYTRIGISSDYNL